MIKAGNLFIPDGDSFFAKKFAETGDRFDYAALQAAARMSRKGVAVDIGAHVGSWSIHLSRWFREVIAFEPNEQNYLCLAENVKEIKNILPCNAAVGSTKGYVSTKKHGTNSGCFNVVNGHDAQMIRLDDFGLMELDLLKIDVEGYEGEVIEGALDAISKFRPIICFENNGLGPKIYGKNWKDPTKLLTTLGYRLAKKIQHDEIWRC